jgi:serine/threonine protein kinase/tetratricopeptide (TPR) repeat protein
MSAHSPDSITLSAQKSITVVVALVVFSARINRGLATTKNHENSRRHPPLGSHDRGTIVEAIIAQGCSKVMDSERMRKLEELYHSAQERKAGERAAFLRGACGNDEELRREVESLLALDSQSGPLERPALALAAHLLAEPTAAELAPGAQLGPYRILSFLGAGGMGQVYKAIDTRLDRVVAIKRLTDRYSARFYHEARVIAGLNHPHICQIYDLGSDYLVLEYIEGQPLHGPVPVEEGRRLAQEIAGALEEAHSRGILHRDLKPANILVDIRGSAKLLDFGLAKLHGRSESDETLTIEGTIMGSAAYMSPEQAQGKRLDERSDIFSFGAVLYELLSGHRAFTGSSTLDVLNAVVHTQPAQLTGPAPLTAIVMRCLRKAPAERFQSMTEIRAALNQVFTEPVAVQPSIAVLPFANMSSSKDDEYFSDGLAEEILNVLAHIPELKVTARTSSFAFRGEKLDIRKIADTLGVRTILQGSVRHAGNRIRVATQLINAADGYHLWSERYDRELLDVFAIQDEIAAAIAGALQVKLAGKPAGKAPHQPNLPAYEAFLKGRHQYFKNTLDTVTRAREYFVQAIELDPEYAEPHAGLGLSYFFLWGYGARPATEMMPLMRAEAQNALDLFASEPGAHALLGVIAATYDYNWKEAEEHFARAMAANPVPPEVRVRHALYNLLPRGRFQEAIKEIEKGIEQDPLSILFRSYLSFILNVAGMYDRAIAEARKSLEIEEGFWATHSMMAHAYAFQGMFAEAIEWAEEAYRLAPWDPNAVGFLAGLQSRAGDEKRANEILAGATSAGTGMMFYHLLRSEIDAAADWYEKGIEQHAPFAVVLATHSFTKPLRASPRWPALARKMNLQEIARA